MMMLACMSGMMVGIPLGIGKRLAHNGKAIQREGCPFTFSHIMEVDMSHTDLIHDVVTKLHNAAKGIVRASKAGDGFFGVLALAVGNGNTEEGIDALATKVLEQAQEGLKPMEKKAAKRTITTAKSSLIKATKAKLPVVSSKGKAFGKSALEHAAKAVKQGHEPATVVAMLEARDTSGLSKAGKTPVSAEVAGMNALEAAMQSIDRLAKVLDGVDDKTLLREIAQAIKTEVPALAAAFG